MTSSSTSIGTLHTPNDLAFMYSRVPVYLTDMTVPDGTPIELYITRADDTSRSYTETRYVYGKRVEFDASAAMRHLADDVKSVFTGDAQYYPSVDFFLRVNNNGSLVKSVNVTALYGAFGPGEEYGMSWGVRRIYMTKSGEWICPVTIPFWIESDLNSFTLLLYSNQGWRIIEDREHSLIEIDVLDYLRASTLSVAKTILSKLKSGHDVPVKTSSRSIGIEDWYIKFNWASVILRPVFVNPLEGKILRWLSRNGTFGYWYFDTNTYQTDVAQRSAFKSYKEGDICAAQYDDTAYFNPVRQDFIETRKILLSTRCETQADYDYLCNLATSPVVQMFDAATDYWYEVNVVPGSFKRRQRFNTPSVQEFGITIELPPRDTITL